MKYYLLILYLLVAASLSAQAGIYDQQIRELRLSLAQNPVDTTSRFALAYLLMLSEDYPGAYNQYDTVFRQDSLSVDAASGKLWALNAQGLFRRTISESQPLVTAFTGHAPISNHRAYALSQVGLHQQSRYYYAQAHRFSRDQQSSAIAREGLAWDYLALGDRYKALHYSLKDDTDFRTAFRKPKLAITLNYNLSNADMQSLGLQSSIQSGLYRLSLKADELLISGEHFRYSAGLGLDVSNPFGQTSFAYTYLDGEDARVYPASHYSLSQEAPVYIKYLSLVPKISAHLGNFERFDTYQGDLSLSLRYSPVSAGISYSKLYQDSDPIDSDRSWDILSLVTSLKIAGRYVVSAYYTQGDQSWWVNPYGAITDDFNSVDESLALSLWAPFGKHLGLLLYHQIGLLDEEYRHFSSLSFTYTL